MYRQAEQARLVCKTFMQGFESPPRLHALVQFCSPLFFHPRLSQAA